MFVHLRPHGVGGQEEKGGGEEVGHLPPPWPPHPPQVQAHHPTLGVFPVSTFLYLLLLFAPFICSLVFVTSIGSAVKKLLKISILEF